MNFFCRKNLPHENKLRSPAKDDYRIVLGYRKFNLFIRKESFPLPLIRNTYDWFVGNHYFSSLDATSEFI